MKFEFTITGVDDMHEFPLILENYNELQVAPIQCSTALLIYNFTTI